MYFELLLISFSFGVNSSRYKSSFSIYNLKLLILLISVLVISNLHVRSNISFNLFVKKEVTIFPFLMNLNFLFVMVLPSISSNKSGIDDSFSLIYSSLFSINNLIKLSLSAIVNFFPIVGEITSFGI